MALVAAAAPGAHTIGALDVELLTVCELPASRLDDALLESVRQTVPAARALPLLAAIAGGTPATVMFDYPAGARLAVKIAPCR